MNKAPIWFTATLGLSMLFTGCTSLSTASSQNLSQDLKQQLVTDQPIISYFSKTPNFQDCGCVSAIDPHYSLNPVEDGYFRKLLGRDQAGRFLVQDFYQSNQKPQSSPIWIKDPLGLFSFENQYVSGPVTLYFPNGTVSYKATLEDGEEIGVSQSYYANGKLGIESDPAENDSYKERMWYSDGAKAADISVSNDEYAQINGGQIWDKLGQLVEDEDKQSDIINGIYAQLDQDINQH